MRMLQKVLMVWAAVLAMSTSVLSAGNDVSIERVIEVKRDLASRANAQKGYPRALLDLERLRLVQLIDDLEAGKQVDPSEIDKALEHANRVGR